jgi:hypothetical protein
MWGQISGWSVRQRPTRQAAAFIGINTEIDFIDFHMLKN